LQGFSRSGGPQEQQAQEETSRRFLVEIKGTGKNLRDVKTLARLKKLSKEANPSVIANPRCSCGGVAI
jgi:hypothetical protein